MALAPWAVAVIADLEHEGGVQITVVEELTGGKSGALVAVVDVEGGEDGVFVLKVGQLSNEYENEDERHQRAYEAPFFRGRIPKPLATVRTATHYGILMEVSGRSRLRFRPLANDPRLFGEAYEALCVALWDPEHFSRTELRTDEAILHEVLGYRLHPNAGGRIHSNHVAAFPHIRVDVTHFVFARRTLPNPLAFLSGGAAPRKARFLLGPVHGDCHPGNVFVHVTGDGKVTEIALIDFGALENAGLFYFDHACFELAILLRNLDNIGDQRWYSLAAALASNHSLSALPQIERAWAQDVLRGRRTALTIASEKYPERADDLELQALLAAIAAGLAFLNKPAKEGEGSFGLTAQQYKQALSWSAVHLQAYLARTGAAFEVRATALPVLGDESHLQSSITDTTWTRFAGFEQDFRILIFNSATMSPADVASVVEARQWKLVVDMATSPPPQSEEFRYIWPESPPFDAKLMRRSGVWCFVNGRVDVSGATPATDTRSWKRQHSRWLATVLAEIDRALSPRAAYVLAFAAGIDESMLRLLADMIDSAFGERLSGFLIGGSEFLIDADAAFVGERAAVEKLLLTRPPTFGDTAADESVPVRDADNNVVLRTLPVELLRTIERDGAIVTRGKASFMPSGRIFGIDFHRGMPVEWAELDHGLDVQRVAAGALAESVAEKLQDSKLSLFELFHEPSAGGTTVGRRVAWQLHDRYPVYVLQQVSADTAEYLAQLFRFASLPILILVEADVAPESTRDLLIDKLHDLNVRAVFLWVSRTYEKQPGRHVLRAQLTDAEAREFLASYLEDVDDATRISALEALAAERDDPQRSAFFFGLLAFGDNYLGLSRLVENVFALTSSEARTLLTDLALVSSYSSAGFPTIEFDELWERRCEQMDVMALTEPLTVRTQEFIRVPHVLIADRILATAARAADWRTKLYSLAMGLLSRLRDLRSRDSLRIKRLVEAVFLTRDTVRALENDLRQSVGVRRFSPLISNIGNAGKERAILRELQDTWRDQAHHKIHYARHLLYEEPKEIAVAVGVMVEALKIPGAAEDPTVLHVVGLCYRFRMNETLRVARAAKRKFSAIEEEVKSDFDEALSQFARSTELTEGRSEYGPVSTIQLVTELFRGGGDLANERLIDFYRRNRRPWLLSAIFVAEREIARVRALGHTPTEHAAKAMEAWDHAFMEPDKLVAELRISLGKRSDAPSRRALYAALIRKHARLWRSVPQNDLAEIASLAERNLFSGDNEDEDFRYWFHAVRRLPDFDVDIAIERLMAWAQMNPSHVMPPFALSVLYFVRWRNSRLHHRDGHESNHWLRVSAANRGVGQRTWSREWLTRSGQVLECTDRADFEDDPVEAILSPSEENRRTLRLLTRIEGTISDFLGPRHATLDFGDHVTAHFVPGDRIVRGDIGKRATGYLSFSYGDRQAWDVERVGKQK